MVSGTTGDGGAGGGDGKRDARTGCTTHAVPPSVNVDASQWAASFLTAPAWNCTASGTTTIDSATGMVSSTSCALGNVTGNNNVAQLDSTGPAVFVVRLTHLSITNGHVLRLTGDKPIILLVAGDVLVDSGGLIDAGATNMTPGPGGSSALCVDHASGRGTQASSSGWGGGGGGFGTAGGQGGYNIVNGGLSTGMASLIPLRGGCVGGTGNGAAASGQFGGAGGGAVEIAASGTITVGSAGAGIIAASGGGAPAFTGGGNGGGSGGAILLVAPTAPGFGTMGTARAHGGSGSEGSSSGNSNAAGGDGHINDDNPATDTSGVAGGGNGYDHGRTGGLAYKIGAGAVMTAPGNMTSAQTGGRGGGGGGGGRIVLTTSAASTSCD